MQQAFVDYYRCPPEFGNFGVRGEMSANEGYFTFRDTVCYGLAARPSLPTSVEPGLPDLSDDVAVLPEGIGLPFDFSEVIGNLRHERYHQNSKTIVTKLTESGVSERLYYLARPALPVAVRKHLQRIRLNGWNHIRFPSWPVDVTVDSLMERALALALSGSDASRVPFVWFWPDGASSAAIVTHDVEAPAGYAFCERLMEIDESFGIRSSFQIVPELRYQAPRDLAEQLTARGFEVNVHDLNHDGRLFHDGLEFRDRATQINRYLREFGSRGFRSACMYRVQDWLGLLDVSYDMSVPNVAHLEPQRGGCCTVMPYFIDDLVELPLTTIQDYSLFQILGQYSIDLWKEQIELILSRNGLITILTHPDYLIEKRAQSVYRDLLDHLCDLRESRDVWFALPGDVEHWWRSRNEMVVVPDGNSWRIEGPESDRARLAYAAVENGRIVYRLDPALTGITNR